MRRILLVQPSLQPPGGSNSVAAWILQALVDRHRVTVLSWNPVDVEPINRFFGTRLAASDFDRIVVPASWRGAADHLPLPLSLIKSSLLMRYTRRVSGGYDVILGVHNETDYGRRGIQYVHYPTYLRPRPVVDLRWYHRPHFLLEGYYRFADALAGFSLERMKTNVTLANSAWTAGKIEAHLGIRARVLYPPVADPAAHVPWDDRANAFLVIGRISPEKELERVMRILGRVRETHPDVTLTIVGTSDRLTASYMDSLRRLAAAIGPWVTFRENLSRDEINRLMAATRYGIHGMREEHFGMAPAEMVRAGMVTWVSDGGGQVEIVGDEPLLRYRDEEDAVAKIARVLDSPDEQARLVAHLAAQAARFSVDRFCREIREVVEQVALKGDTTY